MADENPNCSSPPSTGEDVNGVGQRRIKQQTVKNIKNVLNQNKGVLYGFWLSDDAGWPAFFNFWNNYDESSVWNPDLYTGPNNGGQTWGGGHSVLIVGYNGFGVF